MAPGLTPRDEVAIEQTWDRESIFASGEEWERALVALEATLPTLAGFKGRLGESPATLLEWMRLQSDARRELRRCYVYASMGRDVDTADQEAAARFERVRSLVGRASATLSFGDPELLALGREQLAALLAAEPELAVYEHYVDALYRLAAHTRSPEIESLLSEASDALRTSAVTHSTLADAELVFGSVTDEHGQGVEVAQGTIIRLLGSPSRPTRRAAWELYADAHLRFKNTFATCLAGTVKSNVFYARARGYASALEAATAVDHLPAEVFHTVLDTYRRNLHVWHRYWAVRRRALGVETLHTYDLWAPLQERPIAVPFDQAMEWICAGMAPLGADYVGAMRRGVQQERWVDRCLNRGKRAGAYSTGGQGTHPFILMSYADSMMSMSTLAHELGHSMHSYLTWRHQPYLYSDYSTFVAEVASNFNQALVRGYLLRTHADDRELQIAVIEEAMTNFLRYFFIMPTLARFEHEIHQLVERGDALTAENMSTLMLQLYREGYGSEAQVDDPRDGIHWAEFSTHMHLNYYVFQYATGIAAASALAEGVLAGEPGAVERYLQFLGAGASLYPIDALRLAGVDMRSPEPIERAFKVLEGMVERLEQLIGA